MQPEKLYYCPCKTLKSCNSVYSQRSAHPDHYEELIRIPSELTEQFSFQKKLGSGANGVVFQIYDDNDKIDKAIKLIDFINKAEMKIELKVLLRLHHQYIVRYFKSGMCKKKAYIVMEACDKSLDEYLRKKKDKLTDEKKMRLFLQICQGIAYFHHHPQVNEIYLKIVIFMLFLIPPSSLLPPPPPPSSLLPPFIIIF